MGSIEGVVETSLRRAGSELRLRDARVSELDEIGRLLCEIYVVFRGHLPPQAWERYIGEIVDVGSRLGESELIVAERAGHLIGTIGLYPDASRSPVERWPERWASVRALGVRADARRRGVGEALARECVRRTRERHAKAIGLHTASHMRAATRLYERLGFRRAPGFDIEIGEMFTGRSLPAGETWQAQAYRLDLGELR